MCICLPIKQVLTNGLEVKLQRNALSVLEHPTGLEEDDEDSEDLVPYRTHIGSFLLHICTDLVFFFFVWC